jgi:isoquinoline 1-oxidoreductase subunit beta
MNTPIDRRRFLKFSGILALGFGLAENLGARQLVKMTAANIADLTNLELSPYVLITPDNRITVLCPRPDMGQGTIQSMPMLVAEELEVSLSQIEIVFTNGFEKYGRQTSGGSSSVRTRWNPMRQAGAAAKEMLLKAASNRWQCTSEDVFTLGGKIFHKTDKTKILTFGEVVEDAAKLDVPKTPKLKEIADFKLIGKSIPRHDIPSKTNGSAKFGIDVQLPNMVYAVALHAPTIYGKIKSLDDSQALKTPGVQQVFRSERWLPFTTVETVVVIASNTWAAIRGRDALIVEWENGDSLKTSTDAYFKNLQALKTNEGLSHKELKGDVRTASASAAKVISAEYETPFTAHAPLEPVNATVWVQGDKIEIWAPVQGPEGVVSDINRVHGFAKENIKVNVQLMGGAFGRKAYLDYVVEATTIAKKLSVPVKLTWTREDDLTQGPVRPGMLNVLQGAFDAAGKPIALENKIVGGLLSWQIGKRAPDSGGSWSEGVNIDDSPYEFPNRRTAFVLAETAIPIVWWRSVYASTNVFGHESFTDEMAYSTKKDPLEFRRTLLSQQPRFLNVLDILKEKSGYGSKLPNNWAIGIAIARSFQSIAAFAIIVSKKGEGVKIEKVIGVIDCGIAVNPNQVQAQTEGNIVMGLSAAIKPAITVVEGEVVETNFHAFNPLRIEETPPMEVFVVPSTLDPTGVGEPGLPPIAPALCNAIFNLTGKRIRKLPFDLGNLS